MTDAIRIGREVIETEAEALKQLASRLDARFDQVVSQLIECKGRVVVTGVGKSGHIARKIAATLASTGTPAFFLHSAEAGHGDLGMITALDVVLAISNSGESEEVVNVVIFAKRFGAFIIGLTGKTASALAVNSDLVLDTSVEKEACPLGVAPTSSTTVQLALGDALAMATLSARGFSTNDFARTHPNGALGRKLYMQVKDVMKDISDVPHISENMPLSEAVKKMANSRAGAIVVTTPANTLKGIFTDSDLRRLFNKYAENLDALQNLFMLDIVSSSPLTVDIKHLASEALMLIETHKISRLVCMDGDQVAGLITLHDLIESKIA